MEAIAERIDALFGARFLLVAPRTAEGGVETVLVQRLLQALGLHDVGMLGAAVHERVDAHRHPFRIFMHQQLEAVLFRGAIAELVHFAELPAGIDVQQRERQRAGEERLARQMQHHGRVFADGVKHHRVGEFSGDFTDDMDTLRLQLPQMSESFSSITGP